MTATASSIRACVRRTPSPPRPKRVTWRPVAPRGRVGMGSLMVVFVCVSWVACFWLCHPPRLLLAFVFSHEVGGGEEVALHGAVEIGAGTAGRDLEHRVE